MRLFLTMKQSNAFEVTSLLQSETIHKIKKNFVLQSEAKQSDEFFETHDVSIILDPDTMNTSHHMMYPS